MPVTNDYNTSINFVPEEEYINCILVDFLYSYDKEQFQNDPVASFRSLKNFSKLVNTPMIRLSAKWADVKNVEVKKIVDRVRKRRMARRKIHFVHHLVRCQRCQSLVRSDSPDWEFCWGFNEDEEDTIAGLARHLACFKIDETSGAVRGKLDEDMQKKLLKRVKSKTTVPPAAEATMFTENVNFEEKIQELRKILSVQQHDESHESEEIVLEVPRTSPGQEKDKQEDYQILFEVMIETKKKFKEAVK